MKYNIALDLDGVLAELLEGFCSIYNERYKQNLSIDKINDWNFFEQLGFSEDTLLDFLDEVWSKWWIIPPTEYNMREYLEKISRLDQIAIDIVTCRSEKTVPYVRKWLKKHQIPFRSLIIAKDVNEKFLLEYDIYIDDSPHLMELINSKNTDTIAILYIRPWNSSFKKSKNILRAENWAQIYQILMENIGKSI